MKKPILFIIIVLCAANSAHAQKLNQDTLAKYSKKAEQLRVFNKVAADMHLNAAQSAKFSTLSTTYANKAIAIVKDDKTSRCDKLGLLRQTLKEYTLQIKQVLSPEQIAMLKTEREKYHFGRRFVSMDE